MIDATILHTRGRYCLVFKDERAEPLHKWIKIAAGPTVEGPWGDVSEAFTESWSEDLRLCGWDTPTSFTTITIVLHGVTKRSAPRT